MTNRQKEGANTRARSFPSSYAKAKANSLKVGTGHPRTDQYKSKGYTVCWSQDQKGTEGCGHVAFCVFLALLYLVAVTPPS